MAYYAGRKKHTGASILLLVMFALMMTGMYKSCTSEMDPFAYEATKEYQEYAEQAEALDFQEDYYHKK